MNMTRKLCFTLLLVQVLTGAVTVASQEGTKVTGVVVDRNGSAITGAKVTMTNVYERQSRVVVTADDGEFLFRVMPGLYEIRVESFGFCPEVRPPLHIKVGSVQHFRVPMVVCSVVTRIEVSKTEKGGSAKTTYHIPFLSEVLFLDNNDDSQPPALVRYGRKTESGTGVKFSFFHDGSGTISPVQLVYGPTIVSALHITKLNGLRFLAKDRVVVHDGKTEQKFDRVTFSMRNGHVQINRNR